MIHYFQGETFYLGFKAIYYLLAALNFCVKSAIFFSIVIASLPVKAMFQIDRKREKCKDAGCFTSFFWEKVYLYEANQRRNSSSISEWDGSGFGQYHDGDEDSTDSNLSVARSHLEPDEVIEAEVVTSFDTSDDED